MKSVGYDMEELLPLVAWLAAKYTSGESTSVSYETANMLMEAVCYCIGEAQQADAGEAPEGGRLAECGETVERSENAESGKGGPERKLQEAEAGKRTAEESYRQGYARVLEKTRRTQERYNELIADFEAYGNGNYRDAVLKALPEFFVKYDSRFAPQDTVIGLDYPTLRPISRDAAGIDAVERYIAYIAVEQRFFRRLPEGMTEELLNRFHGEYRELFFNLCGIPLRHMLAAGLLGKQPGGEFSEGEYAVLEGICAHRERGALEELLNCLTEKLVERGWGQDEELLWYLRGDLENFSAELAEGAKRGALRNVVV